MADPVTQFSGSAPFGAFGPFDNPCTPGPDGIAGTVNFSGHTHIHAGELDQFTVQLHGSVTSAAGLRYQVNHQETLLLHDLLPASAPFQFKA